MKRHSAWAVAAAILIDEDDALHYEELARRVIKTNLTGLAEDGGATPVKTMRSNLTKTKRPDGRDVFEEDFFADKGYFCVIDPEKTRQMPKVAEAIEALRTKKVNS